MFFGAAGRQLFGMYHAPTGSAIRDAGVVLCYSGPHEYTQVHWAYQKLAGLLSAAGFHVLRFDYSGTGDSFGDTATSSTAAWVDDIGTAVSELRGIAGIRRIALVGVRLGAALAVRAIAGGVKARDVVLWDPVVQGSEYVARLENAEDFRLQLLNYPEPNDRVPDELLGYPFSAKQRAEALAMTIDAAALSRVDRVLLVASTLSDTQRALGQHATSEGVDVTASSIDDPAFHACDRHPNDPVLSHNIPVAITAFLARSAA